MKYPISVDRMIDVFYFHENGIEMVKMSSEHFEAMLRAVDREAASTSSTESGQ